MVVCATLYARTLQCPPSPDICCWSPPHAHARALQVTPCVCSFVGSAWRLDARSQRRLDGRVRLPRRAVCYHARAHHAQAAMCKAQHASGNTTDNPLPAVRWDQSGGTVTQQPKTVFGSQCAPVERSARATRALFSAALVVDVSDAVSVEYCLFLSPVRAVQFPVVFMCFVFPSGFGRSSYGRADSISRTDSIGQVSEHRTTPERRMAPRRSGAWHHARAAHGTTPERRMAPRPSGAASMPAARSGLRVAV